MIVTFEKEYLQEMFEKGNTTDKKHRYQPQIIRKYKRCINILLETDCIEDLFVIKGLNYEVLKGDKKGLSSIKVNDQYRIEFEEGYTESEPIITICNIIEFQIIINKNIMITIKGIDSRMIANNLIPYEPTHPGEILKDEIEYRAISQRRLAIQMEISYNILNDILNCRRPLSANTAMLFEAALGIKAEMLMRMQLKYNMQVASQDKTFAERLAKIRKYAAVL